MERFRISFYVIAKATIYGFWFGECAIFYGQLSLHNLKNDIDIMYECQFSLSEDINLTKDIKSLLNFNIFFLHRSN